MNFRHSNSLDTKATGLRLLRACIGHRRTWHTVLALLVAMMTSSYGVYAQHAHDPWKSSQLMTPSKLAKILAVKKSKKPYILYVGFPFFYENGHIDGAAFAGPAAKPAGIEELKKVARDIPRNHEVVIYCGCCPWNECPNIRPAFQTLEDLGFKNIRVLDIPHNFHIDWVRKNFPVQRGQSPSHG